MFKLTVDPHRDWGHVVNPFILKQTARRHPHAAWCMPSLATHPSYRLNVLARFRCGGPSMDWRRSVGLVNGNICIMSVAQSRALMMEIAAFEQMMLCMVPDFDTDADVDFGRLAM